MPNSKNVIVLYVTAKDEKEAKNIGRALVKKRLAACVNIFPEMKSIYSWKGKIEAAHEVVLLAKTTRRKLESAKREIVKLHSYELPCILAFEAVGGLDSYLRYIEDETQQ